MAVENNKLVPRVLILGLDEEIKGKLVDTLVGEGPLDLGSEEVRWVNLLGEEFSQLMEELPELAPGLMMVILDERQTEIIQKQQAVIDVINKRKKRNRIQFPELVSISCSSRESRLLNLDFSIDENNGVGDEILKIWKMIVKRRMPKLIRKITHKLANIVGAIREGHHSSIDLDLMSETIQVLESLDADSMVSRLAQKRSQLIKILDQFDVESTEAVAQLRRLVSEWDDLVSEIYVLKKPDKQDLVSLGEEPEKRYENEEILRKLQPCLAEELLDLDRDELQERCLELCPRLKVKYSEGEDKLLIVGETNDGRKFFAKMYSNLKFAKLVEVLTNYLADWIDEQGGFEFRGRKVNFSRGKRWQNFLIFPYLNLKSEPEDIILDFVDKLYDFLKKHELPMQIFTYLTYWVELVEVKNENGEEQLWAIDVIDDSYATLDRAVKYNG